MFVEYWITKKNSFLLPNGRHVAAPQQERWGVLLVRRIAHKLLKNDKLSIPLHEVHQRIEGFVYPLFSAQKTAGV
jgi:hypothetical protein